MTQADLLARDPMASWCSERMRQCRHQKRMLTMRPNAPRLRSDERIKKTGLPSHADPSAQVIAQYSATHFSTVMTSGGCA